MLTGKNLIYPTDFTVEQQLCGENFGNHVF